MRFPRLPVSGGSPRRGMRLPLIVLLLGLVPLTACGRPAGASPDGPPSPSGPGRPGDLVEQTEVRGAPPGIRAWRIVYRSRTFSSSTALVSGLVLAPTAPAISTAPTVPTVPTAKTVPTGSTVTAASTVTTATVTTVTTALSTATAVPTGGRRVVSFAHGTTGVADSCAPSVAEPPLAAAAWTFSLVRAGYVVTLTDYAGLGTPGEHAIYVAGPEGRAALDIVRAARAIRASGAGRDVVLWGYSQGGQAVLSAGAQATAYAPDLQVRGVIATAPLADLPASLTALEHHSDGVAYLLLAMIGAADADHRINLNSYLTPKGRRLLAIARTRCAPDLLAASNGVPVGAAFRQNPLRLTPFATAFARQRDEVTRRMAPTLILQGDRDTVIRRQDTDRVVRRLCATGTTVDYRRYPQANHGTVLGASMTDLTSWTARRFAPHPLAVTDICP
ncbi:lipase family protein [Frankia sp. AgPm24]|uniref:lipase family protein n=1 Tax=Frankia sp. AgPm24 TaxID=631128 RepID=UPI00200F66F1|nr:lipase family protein [Frankia sp. AgPm24]